MIINFHPSAQETVNGTSEVFQDQSMALVGLFVNVSDATGILPSLTVTLQQSPDNEHWYNVGSISVTRTTAGQASASPPALALLADYIRLYWTISGCFTFQADVVVHKIVK